MNMNDMYREDADAKTALEGVVAVSKLKEI